MTELDIAKLTPFHIHWFPCWQPCLHIWHFLRSWSNVIMKNKMWLLFTVVYVGDESLKFQQRLDTALCFHSWRAVDLKVQFARPRHIFTYWNILQMISALNVAILSTGSWQYATICCFHYRWFMSQHSVYQSFTDILCISSTVSFIKPNECLSPVWIIEIYRYLSSASALS